MCAWTQLLAVLSRARLRQEGAVLLRHTVVVVNQQTTAGCGDDDDGLCLLLVRVGVDADVLSNTEFLSPASVVQGQCGPVPTGAVVFGGEAPVGGGGGCGVGGGVLAAAPVSVVATSVAAMNQLGTVYATKRRRRNGKSLKPTPKDGVTKSNPSKRHRERLNAELDTLASLLPFEQNILSKLDRLSILRLSVSYLRTKSYFQVVMHKDKEEGGGLHRQRDLTAFDHTPLDGEMFLQVISKALNGFLMILTCEGEVFFATHSIEGYLGFHQSDIVHQSVYELVHSEDREELQRQLMWNSFLPPESANIGLQDVLLPDNCHMLERSFTVRFRCLLDNTSGFLRLDIRGRVKVLHGQNRKSDEPPLALFAICTPFGPPSLLEIPQKEIMFKSKHKLDLGLVSMDQRGKMLLGYSDSELANMGGYDLVHYDDLAYVASAHQELLKTGASGMIAYRLQTKDGQWQWLQTSSRLVYKNSKPDFIISTHRPLMEEEGRDLLGKRTMDFKVSYLDAGLPNSYFTESDQLLASSPNVAQHSISTTSSRVNRRYKTQLRDFLSTCRTKRKLSHSSSSGQATPPTSATVSASVVSPMGGVDYITSDGCTATYNMYASPYPSTATDHSLSYMGHSNFQHSLYPASATLDNRYLTTTENIFHQYRPLSSYYPDYHSPATSPYVGNGFLEMSSRTSAVPAYDAVTPNSHHPTYRAAVMPVDEKLYPCQQVAVDPTTTAKYSAYVEGSRGYVVTNSTKCLDVSWPYSVSPSSGIIQPVQVMSAQLDIKQCAKISKHASVDGVSSTHSSPPINPSLLAPKMEEVKDPSMLQTNSPNTHHIPHRQGVTPQHFSPVTTTVQDTPRQTVLMWGSNHVQQARSPSASTEYGTVPVSEGCEALKSLAEISNPEICKWNGENTSKTESVAQSSDSGSPHQHHSTHHNNHHNGRVVMVL